MKKIYIFATAVAIMSTVFLVVKYGINREGGLVGSTFILQVGRQQPSPSPTPISTPGTPKTFQFDSSTDLMMELEKVNPQILDSDFE